MTLCFPALSVVCRSVGRAFGRPAVRVAAVLSVLVVVAVGSLVAQTVPAPIVVPQNTGFGECIGQVAVEPRLATTSEASETRSDSSNPFVFQSPGDVLKTAVACAHAYTRRVMVPTGMMLLTGISLIMVVWTGVLIMFSGRFDMAMILNQILLIGFAFMVMTGFEENGNMWGDRSFPQLIYQQGEVVAVQLVESSLRDLMARVNGLISAWTGNNSGSNALGIIRVLFFFALGGPAAGGRAALEQVGIPGNWDDLIKVATSVFDVVFILAESLMLFLLFLVFLIPCVVLYCSYLWGYLGVIVSVILGPLFIPFLLVPTMDWVFWSWVKSIIKAAVYMMVAAVLFAVCVQLLQIPFQRISAVILLGELGTQGDGGVGDSILGNFTGLFSSIVAYIPIALLMLVTCGKTGAMTQMLTEGGGMPGSGAQQIGARVGQVTKGSERARGAAKSVGGAAGGAVGGAAGRVRGGMSKGRT